MNYIEKFLLYLENEKNYSELTIINYRKDLYEFFIFLGEKDICNVTKNDVDFF